MAKANRYKQIIEKIFLDRYRPGSREVFFERDEFVSIAAELGIKLPKNLGDLPYTFRYRGDLPQSICDKAPTDEHWIIRPAGRGRYCFALTRLPLILPNELLAETKIPDATPGVIELYALSDEQALLAKLRYNRLVDIFTAVTCYSLQSHLRTAVPGMGQVETDEIYVGIDRRGGHFVFPIQAKGGRDRLSVVQIEQGFAMCARKFPALRCRPLAGQFMADRLIALFEFALDENGVAILNEKHYRLVPPDELSADEVRAYLDRPDA